MIAIGDRARVLVCQNRGNTLADHLEGLEVAARGHRVALLLVLIDVVGIPVSRAHAFDQIGADAIALDRKGMVGVCLVNIVYALEIGFGVIGHSRAFGKVFDDGVAHGLPHQTDAAGIGGPLSVRQGEVKSAVKRIGFADRVAGGLHGGDDLIGDPVAADIAERAGEPSGDDTLPPVEEQVKNVGCVRNLGERRACVDRMGPEKPFGHVDQCRPQAEQAQAVLLCHLVRERHDQTHLEDGGAEQ